MNARRATVTGPPVEAPPPIVCSKCGRRGIASPETHTCRNTKNPRMCPWPGCAHVAETIPERNVHVLEECELHPKRGTRARPNGSGA
jgi:hypothetical protein